MTENGGGRRHGRGERHTETNYGVEGRYTMADNAMRTAAETLYDEK